MELTTVFFGNSILSYLISLGVFVAAVVVLRLFKFLGLFKLRHLAKRTKNEYDDLIVSMVDALGWPFYIVVSVYIGLIYLKVPQIVYTVLNFLTLILGIFYVTKSLMKLVDFFSNRVAEKRQEATKDKVDTSVIRFLGNLVKGVLWVIALLLFLQNVGINITSLIAGLGIGGIAIAFALQNVLADLFASVSIYFDKPFEVGDFIVIGDDLGTVEHIGLKSTRIKALKGQLLVVSNKELTSTRINNYKKMNHRRIVFEVGVTYSTPSNKLEKIPKMVIDILKKVKHATPDRVHFKEFGNSSLKYEIVYYVDSKDYNMYMDTQQEINLQIVKAFEKEGLDFAFPTQTIHLEK